MKRLLASVVLMSGVGVGFASGPPQDYPFRVQAVRLVQVSPNGAYAGNNIGPDRPEGRGYAAVFDRNGATEALEFRYHDTGCFYRPKDLFFQVGGFYPARWVNDHEIVLATNVNALGKVSECRMSVKRSAIPDTADYRKLAAYGAGEMAKIYARTSVTNPPARPAKIRVVVGPAPSPYVGGPDASVRGIP
jgi:hypothetical protein